MSTTRTPAAPGSEPAHRRHRRGSTPGWDRRQTCTPGRSSSSRIAHDDVAVADYQGEWGVGRFLEWGEQRGSLAAMTRACLCAAQASKGGSLSLPGAQSTQSAARLTPAERCSRTTVGAARTGVATEVEATGVSTSLAASALDHGSDNFDISTTSRITVRTTYPRC